MHDDLALIHALALGQEYGTQPNIQRVQEIDAADLRTLAMRALKQENIGVSREGPRFIVGQPYIDAFTDGLRRSAPQMRITATVLTPRKSTTQQRIERDRDRIAKDKERIAYDDELYKQMLSAALRRRAELRLARKQMTLF